MRVYSKHHPYSSCPLTLLCVAALLMSCATAQQNEWDNLDYSSVYRKAKARGDNDSTYTPSYNMCVDDDIMNCQ